MIRAYKYDENYVWEETGEILVDVENGEEIPEGYTAVRPQDGLFIKTFDPEKEEWCEGATQEYIDSLFPEAAPSELEIVRQQQAELVFTLMMKGVI
ncbi:hypothetical protein [Bacillus pumilus]|uniref:hypothetical protein n=1 Tax=Bacillus pumilus TaxID=1408 RepID=UPI0015D55989|nr:hypothetical protein [Bacillus pumilus]QLI77176.1 hypothetical protein HZ310_04845 [Bacillus pumilus]